MPQKCSKKAAFGDMSLFFIELKTRRTAAYVFVRKMDLYSCIMNDIIKCECRIN